ncbi:hypothetical protein GF324_09275, partial [bacterium]|nr:hypothetical protein [bacterium]
FFVSGPINMEFVQTIDFDADGLMDLVVGTSTTIEVWLNNGEGVDVYTVASNYISETVYPADMDGDGDLDIVAASMDDDRVDVFLNEWPTFTQEVINTDDASPVKALPWDVNKDGLVDLVYASLSGVVWYENVTDPEGFGMTRHDINTNRTDIRDFIIGDFSEAGLPPIVGINSDTIFGWTPSLDYSSWTSEELGSAISVDLRCLAYYDQTMPIVTGGGSGYTLLGWEEGDGGNLQGQVLDAGGLPPITSLAVADLNEDGIQDITGASDAGWSAYWWNGGNEFFRTQPGGVSDPQNISVADIDIDGDPDIIIAQSDAEQIDFYQHMDASETGELPTVFRPILPMDHDKLIGSTADLSWSQSTDPNGAGISYEVQYDNDPTLTSPDLIDAGTATNAQITGVQADEMIYWRVRAYNSEGGEERFTERRQFEGPLPDLAIVEPTAATTWTPGDEATIQWSNYDTRNAAEVMIEIFDGELWGTLSSTVTNNGLYTFTVPYIWNGSAIQEGAQWNVRVTEDGEVVRSAESETFTLGGAEIAVTSPAGGETWTYDNEYLIAWDPVDISGGVNLYLLQNDSRLGAITFEIQDDGSYTWFVETEFNGDMLETGEYTIEVEDLGQQVNGYSQPFTLEMPTAPSDFDLLTPEADAVITELPLTLTWEEATDPDPNDEITYGIWLYQTPPPGEQTIVGPPSIWTTDTFYEVTDLADNTNYTWSVKAEDSFGLSSNSTEGRQFDVSLPDPPGAFSLAGPEDGHVSSTTAVELSWNESEDPDPNDTVTYDVFVSTNPDEMGDPVATGVSGLSYSYEGMDDQFYYWMVEAVDTQGNRTGSTETWTFEIYIEDNPLPFNLVSPEDLHVSPSYAVQLEWESTTDPDPNQTVQYEVYIAETQDGLVEPVATVPGTSYTHEGPDDTQWYWTIRAVDDLGNGTDANETRSFSIAVQDAPGTFGLTAPAFDEVIGTPSVDLAWETSTDPDGDDVFYDVYLTTDPDALTDLQNISISPAVSGLSTTTTTLSVGDDLQYYWVVRAYDEFDNEGWPSGYSTFSVFIEQDPGPFSLEFPTDGQTVGQIPVNLQWTASTDPDPDQSVTYNLFIGATESEVLGGDPYTTGLTETSFSYDADDDSEYWWRVEAVDNTGRVTSAGDPWQFFTAVPQGPGEFSLLSPGHFSTLTTLDVTLDWTDAVDPDPNDPVVYDVYLAATQDALYEDPPVATDLSVSEYSFVSGDDQSYWWRVVARDTGGLTNDQVSPWQFNVAVPEPPSEFSYLSPEDGVELTELNVTLDWEDSFDPDPGGTVLYDVYIANTYEDVMSGDPYAQAQPLSEYSFSADDDQTYWWRVIVNDDNGGVNDSNEPWMFTTSAPEPPNSFVLNSPNDGEIIEGYPVTLSWEATTDPDPEQTLEYDLYVGTDPAGLLEGTPEAFGLTGTSYDFSGEDDTDYYWQVVARSVEDGLETSSDGPRGFSVDIPQQPTAFSLLAPTDASQFTSYPVSLSWSESTDPDPDDVVTYRVLVADNPDMIDANEVANGLLDTGFDFTGEDDSSYWWTVEAMDQDGFSVQADAVWSFSVALPEAPGEFGRLEPMNESIMDGLTVLLDWTDAVDPDPGDNVTYELYLSTDYNTALNGPPHVSGLVESEYTFEADDDLTYWWRVVANDDQGNSTDADDGQPWNFNTDLREPPGGFNLSGPADGAVIENFPVTLSWETSTDPDPGQTPVYDLYISTDAVGDLLNTDPYALNLTEASYDFNGEDNQLYYWQVVARDLDGFETPSNEYRSFSVDVPEPPNSFSQTAPEPGTVVSSWPVTLQWEVPTDPDPQEEITYNLYIGPDPDGLLQDDPAHIGLLNNSFDFSGEDDFTYYWQVVAVDSDGLETASDAPFSFSSAIPEPPAAFNLLGPADGSTSEFATVSLNWDASTDPDPDETPVYDLFVSTNPDGLTQGDPTAFGLTSTNYEFTGNDDTQYYWQVVARDPGGSTTVAANGPRSFDIAVPEPPNPFALESPVNGGQVTELETILSWETSTDPDEEQVTYSIWVSTDPNAFEDLGNVGTPTSTGLTTESYSFTGEEDETYYWHVRADDPTGRSTWADQAFSYSIYIEDPPTAFNLLDPADEYVSPSTMVELTWNATTDPDPGQDVTYDLFVSTDEGDLGDAIATGLTSTFYEFTGDDDQTYYWTVEAVDPNNNRTQADEIRSFSIYVEQAPQPFSLLEPADEDTTYDGSQAFSWQTAVDPDPDDAVSYVLYWATDDQFTDPDSSETAETSATVTGLSDDTSYWWRVRAFDTQGNSTFSNQTPELRVYIPEAPNDFALLSPEDGSTVAENEVMVSWEAATDPDPNDNILYTVEWSVDENFETSYTAETEETSYTITDLADMVARMLGIDELPDDTEIFWRVSASDDWDNSTFATPETGWSFSIYIPEPPAAFSLLTPEDETVLDEDNTTLTWEESTDPDPDNSLMYVVWTATDPDFTTDLDSTETANTELAIDGLSDDTSYWWKVRAQDLDTNGDPASMGTWSSEVFRFDIFIPEAPNDFA